MKSKDKKKLDTQKLRGGYYTPPAIAQFICSWAITKPSQRILEPSCGDGIFIESAIRRFNKLGVSSDQLVGSIKGIELIDQEARKSKDRAASLGLNSTTIINDDFFNYISNANGEAHFDAVIGNPPFIRYQNFPEKHRDLAFEMMQKMNLHPNKLTNIWVPFLVISAGALNKHGKLGMVIPAELFQVKYAAETRVFLSKFFSRITIVTFKKLVFDDIQQEVVLLLCEKDTASNNGIRVVELNTLDDLSSLQLTQIQKEEVKVLDHSTEKWTKYFLDEHEIELLRKIKKDDRLLRCGDYFEVDVGLVTGRNEFFMLSIEEVRKWKLEKYTRQVLSKSNHFKGISFNQSDFQKNSDESQKVHLFLPPDKDYEELPSACQKYVSYGQEMKFHVGYKCRIRKRWYITPSLWNPDAFVLRQVGDYSKLIINKTEASSTDTIHRVRFKTKAKHEIIALSYLNSLTFAFSEILGRSYGGGVLTFEPSEVEEIPLPLLKENSIDFNRIDSLMRERKIHEILDIVDKELLIHQLHYSKKDVEILRSIWVKLSERRNKRNKS